MKTFEQQLMEKYPELFHKNDDGELECACGVWVPPGWEKIINGLCCSMVQYTTSTYRTKIQVINKMYYVWSSCADVLDWMHTKFVRLFPKYNNWEHNKPFFALVAKLRAKYYKCIKYNRVYPPKVQINQIKEKFGGLRFYYTGGDDHVAGMIQFAEYLCNKTCEVTGEDGVLCVRGGWYKTLSLNLLQQDPYNGYVASKNGCN